MWLVEDQAVQEQAWQAEQFERHRAHLRAVAYRMLGSAAEAEDAVQEAWLRLSQSRDRAITNLGGWLTTVVGRVCLDMLRARRTRREYYIGSWEPEPPDSARDGEGPEQQTVLADSVGLALMVVLETLTPAERLAFVLHDMFAVPFEDIAPLVNRGPGIIVPAPAGVFGVARLTIAGDRITAIDLVIDPARLRAYVVEE